MEVWIRKRGACNNPRLTFGFDGFNTKHQHTSEKGARELIAARGRVRPPLIAARIARGCRAASLARNLHPVEPYSRRIPRLLGGS